MTWVQVNASDAQSLFCWTCECQPDEPIRHTIFRCTSSRMLEHVRHAHHNELVEIKMLARDTTLTQIVRALSSQLI